MEKEDSVRTVDCLRGRLLAERAVSRNAKEEAEQLGNKLMELENLLKQESKSRNRAEKKLKSLIKKLESIDISYTSDESGLMGKSDISSIPSTVSSSIKDEHLFEDLLSSASDEHSEKSSSKMDQQSDICYDSIRSTNESFNKDDDQDSENQMDNPMALVLVDTPEKNHPIDPEILDVTVKEVLDALRRAKEQLQSSMERRRMNMIRVG